MKKIGIVAVILALLAAFFYFVDEVDEGLARMSRG